jgi:hypothetical protein
VQRLISETVLLGQASDPESRQNLTARIESEAKAAATSGFDLDSAIDEDFTESPRESSPLSLDELDLVIHATGVLPPGIEIHTMSAREYSYLAPGMPEHLRVTTDAAYYEEYSESVELWSPGNPLFSTVEIADDVALSPPDRSIRKLLLDRRFTTSAK